MNLFSGSVEEGGGTWIATGYEISQPDQRGTVNKVGLSVTWVKKGPEHTLIQSPHPLLTLKPAKLQKHKNRRPLREKSTLCPARRRQGETGGAAVWLKIKREQWWEERWFDWTTERGCKMAAEQPMSPLWQGGACLLWKDSVCVNKCIPGWMVSGGGWGRWGGWEKGIIGADRENRKGRPVWVAGRSNKCSV